MIKRVVFSAVLFAAALAADQAPNEKDLTLESANFILLLIIVGYMVVKMGPPFFRSRGDEIQRGIAEAQKMKNEAEQRARQMEAKLASLGAEIEKFRSQARAEMEQEGARIRHETARQIEKLGRQAELEIETAGKVARRELRAYAAELALELAERQVKSRLNPAAENVLIEDFVSGLEASRN